MNYSFNLIDRPWIPCITVDGGSVEVSLHEMLAQAHHLREIACETPLMTSAILPLTLALLHRVFGPANTGDWERLWQQGAFLMAPIEAYMQQWYDRFDLFHPERPFYQVKDERVQEKSAIHLVHSIGNTGTLFTHAHDAAAPQLSPETAARHLIAAQMFRTAGLSGLPEKFTDSPMTRGVIFWASGETLFETLLFNLMVYPGSGIFHHTPDDAPVWEQDAPFRLRNHPYGYLDYLTWTSKRIWLSPETINGDLVVNKMTIAPGLHLAADVHSPQKRYSAKMDKEGSKTWSFLYFNANKALWRDYHSLVNLHDNNTRPPAVIDWLAELAEYVLSAGTPVHLIATGMLADQAKLFFYRQERLPLPLNLIGDDGRIYLISQAIKAADDVAVRVDMAVRELAEHVLLRGSERKPDGTDIRNLTAQWDVLSRYWSELETSFWEFVDQLSQHRDDAFDTWKEALLKTARDTFEEASRMSGTSAPALRGQVVARAKLNAGLKKVLNS